jgi:hypothetical protein
VDFPDDRLVGFRALGSGAFRSLSLFCKLLIKRADVEGWLVERLWVVFARLLVDLVAYFGMLNSSLAGDYSTHGLFYCRQPLWL